MMLHQFRNVAAVEHYIAFLVDIFLRSMKSVPLFGLFILSSSPSLTLGQDVLMEPVLVTATRLEEAVSSTPASATVITGEEMERKGAVTVEEAIRDAPGIYVRRAGTIGASTSIRIQGADFTQTLVLIDEVGVNNSWTGPFDCANLMVDNVERVEVVRNTQRALYGSEAMGGVINIITKKGEGSPTATVSGEGGSFDTYRGLGNLAGSWGIAFEFGNSGIVEISPAEDQ